MIGETKTQTIYIVPKSTMFLWRIRPHRPDARTVYLGLNEVSMERRTVKQQVAVLTVGKACIVAKHRSFNCIRQVAPKYTPFNTWFLRPTSAFKIQMAS